VNAGKWPEDRRRSVSRAASIVGDIGRRVREKVAAHPVMAGGAAGGD